MGGDRPVNHPIKLFPQGQTGWDPYYGGLYTRIYGHGAQPYTTALDHEDVRSELLALWSSGAHIHHVF